MAIRITCINKDGGHHEDPHEAITDLGWINETTQESNKSTRLQIVQWLKASSANQAYVKDAAGNVAYLVVRVSRFNNKYVQTVADGRYTNNLLALPECR